MGSKFRRKCMIHSLCFLCVQLFFTLRLYDDVPHSDLHQEIAHR
ncbi:unnamed protein product [Blumeria hordei]|uniref:Uncharacterized protein n=1 Tax=Blumeria hordei TaxID=2867405 RepID=A0A383UX92_BLUHO|nr:unnamed protein product [Blumeria hordei]